MTRSIRFLLLTVVTTTAAPVILSAGQTPKCTDDCVIQIQDPDTAIGDGANANDRLKTKNKGLHWRINHLNPNGLTIQIRNFKQGTVPACPGTFKVDGHVALPPDNCGAVVSFSGSGTQMVVLKAEDKYAGSVFSFDLAVESGGKTKVIDPELEIDTDHVLQPLLLFAVILLAVLLGLYGLLRARRRRMAPRS